MLKLIPLIEANIGRVQSKINVVMQLDKSNHAGERQSRHGDENHIDDEFIKDTIDSALPKIANALLFDKIDVNKDAVLIQNTVSDLNIVGKIVSNGSMLDFVVITVMTKKNFKAKSGTYTIKV
jgi:hypothetical protein